MAQSICLKYEFRNSVSYYKCRLKIWICVKFCVNWSNAEFMPYNSWLTWAILDVLQPLDFWKLHLSFYLQCDCLNKCKNGANCLFFININGYFHKRQLQITITNYIGGKIIHWLVFWILNVRLPLLIVISPHINPLFRLRKHTDSSYYVHTPIFTLSLKRCAFSNLISDFIPLIEAWKDTQRRQCYRTISKTLIDF